jgi:hypothetical protein
MAKQMADQPSSGNGGAPPGAIAGSAGTSGNPSSPAAGGSVDQLPTQQPKISRGRKGSGNDPLPGRRAMKEYPITEETLDNIGVLKTAAAFCFSSSALLVGFAASDFQSLAMAGGTVSDAVWSMWMTIAIITSFLAVGLGAAGILFHRKEGGTIARIKQETTHE